MKLVIGLFTITVTVDYKIAFLEPDVKGGSMGGDMSSSETVVTFVTG
jgi:hypothetical protein